MSTAPFFLVAARRSGTTLLRLMLKGHPDILFDHGWEAVAEALNAPTAGRSRRYEIKGIAPFEADGSEAFKTAIRARVEEALAERSKTVFGATCHVGFLELQKIWPDARYVHMIRDPRDVAMSSLKLGWRAHPYFASDTWHVAETDWGRLKDTLPNERRFELRYEALVSAPQAELARLCEFLGVPYNDALFSYTETSSYSFPKAELAERWRRSLSTDSLTKIEARIRLLMTERGYAPEGKEVSFGPFAQKWFRIADYVGRKRHRLNNVGLASLVEGKIARLSRSERLLALCKNREAARRAEKIARLERNY